MKKIVVFFVGILSGVLIGAKIVFDFADKVVEQQYTRANKNAYILKRACVWLRLRQRGKKIRNWLIQNNIREIAIYGMGELGQCLLNELSGTDIKVSYIIDQNKERYSEHYQCFAPMDTLPEVQLIVVTAVYDYSTIKEKICCGNATKVISLEEVLNELENE